jgi:hypothetical protein
MKQFILSTCKGTIFLSIIIALSCGNTQVDLEQKDVNVVLIDIDGDDIPDDGDNNGTPGDNPCGGGAIRNCDDNCPQDSNSDQV